MRRESELREPEFKFLNSPGDWVIVVEHPTPPRRILFSCVAPTRVACEEVKIIPCLFVSSGRIPWAMMSVCVTVFSHRQSGLIAFFLCLDAPLEQ